MTCPACRAWEERPLCGAYNAACKECSARMLATTQEHWQSRRTRQMTPEYKDALRRAFGADWQAGHQRVKAWAERMEARRATHDTSMAP